MHFYSLLIISFVFYLVYKITKPNINKKYNLVIKLLLLISLVSFIVYSIIYAFPDFIYKSFIADAFILLAGLSLLISSTIQYKFMRQLW